jgi:nicotinate-nucleotide pyrophosphorylase (carboxylating)
MTTQELDKIINASLKEDKAFDDITSKLTIFSNHKSTATMICKEDAIVCGISIVKEIFKKLDKNIKIKAFYKDGAKVRKGTKILLVTGKTAKILSAERTALNFIAHLSGIATLTNLFIKKANQKKVQVLDTRKTTPGLRLLEKYAVKCGGGTNHRMDLSQTVFIKDNHRAFINTKDSYKNILKNIRKKTKKEIIIEVDNLIQFKEALEAHPNIILLDNMSTSQIKKAVILCKEIKKRPLLEASGGVSLKTIANIAKTGVTRISVGSLTHSAQSIDFSLEIDKC